MDSTFTCIACKRRVRRRPGCMDYDHCPFCLASKHCQFGKPCGSAMLPGSRRWNKGKMEMAEWTCLGCGFAYTSPVLYIFTAEAYKTLAGGL
jgi:RNHCP domain